MWDGEILQKRQLEWDGGMREKLIVVNAIKMIISNIKWIRIYQIDWLL